MSLNRSLSRKQINVLTSRGLTVTATSVSGTTAQVYRSLSRDKIKLLTSRAQLTIT